jgi:thiamine biosynthesis lipoprotein
LRGRAAAQALAAAVPISDEESVDAATNTAPAPLVSYKRRAMACEFEVQLAAGRQQDGSALTVLSALDLLEPLEEQMTIYRADSEVLRINREAAAGRAEVEPRLFALFRLAQRIHAETGGAFDVTSSPLSEAWGFSRREGRMPSETEIAAALARVGMDGVELDDASFTVRFRRPGLSLHLNSIGKGYALDRMAERLDGRDGEVDSNGQEGVAVGDYLLHGGRSSVLARGSRPGNQRPGSSKPGWAIGIPHPLVAGERLGEIDLVDQGLGTSGSGTQFFEHGGRRYGHLLDPRTGRPVEGVCAATAIAPTAAEADALSTAFYVMGIDGTAAYCAAHPAIGAILVTAGERAGDLVVSMFGLDPERWRPAAAT